jgi:gamma-glutamylcyclotransferase (GGCT)/AIG2-like uncharacterized protein YtfP
VAAPDEATSLFVYGSLVDEGHREEILGRRVDAVAATVRNYERGRGRHFFVRKRLGASTAGLLVLDLSERDFAALDRYEEIPMLYTREKITVELADGNAARCWIYLPTSATLATPQ